MNHFQFVKVRTQNHFAKSTTKKQYAKRSKASMCREWLKQINSLTFLVLEEGTLDKLKEDLRAAVEDLKVQVPHEAELIKESSSYVTYSLKKGIYWDSFLKSKIKKSELSRGVEIGPEKRRTAITLNIKDTLKKKNSPALTKNQRTTWRRSLVWFRLSNLFRSHNTRWTKRIKKKFIFT